MKTVRLGAIANSLPCDYGDDLTDGAPAFEVVKVSNVSAEGQFHGDFEKRRFRDDQLDGLLVKEGELLVVKSSGSKASILSGKTAICGADRAGRIVASNFLLRLRVDESAAVPRFVWYVLNGGASKAFVKTIVGASTYPNLKWSSYASHPIPLPPLAEQRRITEVLDRAEALRAKRRAALAQLAALTQSLFLDLFGDPFKNPRGWPTFPFSEVSETTQGVQIPRDEQKEEPAEGYERYLYINDFYSDDSPKYIEDHFPQKRVTDDDLVMANTGSPGRVFKGRPGILSNNLFKITFDTKKISTVFFYHFLASDLFQRHLQGQMKQGIQSHLGHKTFGVQKLPLPPLPLQREFARRVTAVEALKTAHRASLAELDALFATLQHRAFKGEL